MRGMLRIDFCKECFHSICFLGLSHAKLYEDICKKHLWGESGCVMWENSEFEELSCRTRALHSLEKHGFIISTELSKEKVRVKPLGLIFCLEDLDSVLICFEFNNHFKES